MFRVCLYALCICIFKARLFSKTLPWQEIKGEPRALQLMVKFLSEAFPASPRNNPELAIWLHQPQRMPAHTSRAPCLSPRRKDSHGLRGQMEHSRARPRAFLYCCPQASTPGPQSPPCIPRTTALPLAPVLRLGYFDIFIPNTS